MVVVSFSARAAVQLRREAGWTAYAVTAAGVLHYIVYAPNRNRAPRSDYAWRTRHMTYMAGGYWDRTWRSSDDLCVGPFTAAVVAVDVWSRLAGLRKGVLHG